MVDGPLGAATRGTVESAARTTGAIAAGFEARIMSFDPKEFCTFCPLGALQRVIKEGR
jgi:hypothetical protein